MLRRQNDRVGILDGLDPRLVLVHVDFSRALHFDDFVDVRLDLLVDDGGARVGCLVKVGAGVGHHLALLVGDFVFRLGLSDGAGQVVMFAVLADGVSRICR